MTKCLHTPDKLTFGKMFMNDNGDFGGQHMEVLLNCECGDTIFIHSYRGNISDQYYKPNTILHRDPKKDLTEFQG